MNSAAHTVLALALAATTGADELPFAFAEPAAPVDVAVSDLLDAVTNATLPEVLNAVADATSSKADEAPPPAKKKSNRRLISIKEARTLLGCEGIAGVSFLRTTKKVGGKVILGVSVKVRAVHASTTTATIFGAFGVKPKHAHSGETNAFLFFPAHLFFNKAEGLNTL